MCERFPSLLYLLAFFPYTLLKIVTASLFSLRSTCKVSQKCRRKCRRKCHRSIREKGTVTKAKSLFVESLDILKKAENFFHKNSVARG